MDVTTLRIVTTCAAFVLFLGIAAWAYARRNSEHFERAGRIPFEQD
jgi:cytochrome c oxidase cbb3-type subunit 4